MNPLPPEHYVDSSKISPPSEGSLQIGNYCLAKYSEDGSYHNAVVENIKNGMFLVRYVDFDDDEEWVPPSFLKAI
jgi:hypothetical protein